MFKFNVSVLVKRLMWVNVCFFAGHFHANASQAECPASFHDLPLLPSAQYCQLFDQELPASLSYFANLHQAESKNFYLENLGQPDKLALEKGRIVLLYKEGQQTIIISSDGNGSQIDMLVKQ